MFSQSGAGLSNFGRNDFDDVAVLQFIVQRDDLAVDLGADAAVADVGVDAVGKVDGDRTLGQVDDVAPRRKTKTSSEKASSFRALTNSFGLLVSCHSRRLRSQPIFSSKASLLAVWLPSL